MLENLIASYIYNPNLSNGRLDISKNTFKSKTEDKNSERF